MRHLSTLLILLSINISLMAQSVGVNLPVSTTANTMLDVNGGVSFREGTALTCVNGVNSNIALADYSFYRVTGPTAAFSITGFGNGVDGRVLTVINASGQNMTLSHLVTSTVANQINTGGSAVVLPANGVATFIYNVNLTKWIVSGTMGDTPTFTNITNGSLTDSILVINNGVPLRVRPVDFIENYAWGIDGNNNITDGTHFLGTTTNVPLSMRVNNQKAGRIDHLNANTFLGYLSGNSVTTGGSNTAIGQNALRSVITNGYNVAMGTDAMLNATGGYNIAIGPGALQSGTSSANIAIGYGALQSTTTGSGNVAIGNLAGSLTTTGTSNTGVGYGSLINNTTGSDNTALGNSTFLANTTGSLNTTVGKWAMYSNTIGQSNTSLGAFSLYNNSTGNGNVAIGYNSLYNANGTGNVGVGYSAGSRLSSGTYNLLLGRESGDYMTTGSNNIILGYQAGSNITTGSNNIVIGANAQVPSATTSNQLSIGNWIYGVNNGDIAIGATLKVGSNATTIDANSVLELESTTKGFVPPRMTTAQMNAITGALVGSVIYNTTLNCLHQKTSSGWLSMCNSTSPFTYESTQTTILSQAFNSAFADIPGVGSLSVTVPRTAAYTITARGYFASGIYTTITSNSGAQGSFKLVVDGTSYDESYLASAGFYNAAGNYNFYGLGAQGTIVKTLTLTAGAHTISIQGRTWFGTNCTVGTWGILTSGYVNSNGADAGKCKLTVIEN